MAKINLPAMPALPSAARPRRVKACHCGCGGTTLATFAPGHDSVLKSWVIRAEAGIDISALDDFPGMKKQVAHYVAERAKGKNPSFMANVELPAAKKEEKAS